MLKFEEIKLEDKSRFEKYTKRYGYHNVEASFANIFIWRKAMNIRMATDDLAMYLHLSSKDISFMLPPLLGNCDTSILEPMLRCEEFLESRGESFLMKGVTVPLKERIERDCSSRYVMVPDRANFEYVYNAQDLIKLEGKKYHAKRNHINRLLDEHSFEYRRYTPDDYDLCMAMYDAWLESKGGLTQSFQNERWATEDALRNLEPLGLKCGLLFVDGKLEGFSIGEKFGDMAIIHFEKANPNLRGAYPLINREFARHEFSDVKYINREEDMGIEGLRKAKLSYHPAFFVEKYTCTRAQ
ncbi:MAG: DUF2156 domain-containing protein [Christensenellales bacterium]|jgi:hypothetical protein